MTDRPIIFSAPMVRALLDGCKTQTRRVIKKKAAHDALETFSPQFLCLPGNRDLLPVPVVIGDRLYVREAHYLTDNGENEYAICAADQGDVDEHLANMQTLMARHPRINWSKHLRLRPSIHMPRWASRLTLTVTDVRVQRLQEISDEDAQAEGMEPLMNPEPVEAFRTLWNSLHGPDAWAANPWVCALTFTVQSGNIDQVPQ